MKKIITILLVLFTVILPAQVSTFQWANKIGGNSQDNGKAMDIDVTGNIYITGSFQNTVDFDPSSSGVYTLTSSGWRDIYVAKYNPSGNFLWAKQFIGNPNINEEGLSIIIDSLGNVITTGYFQGTVDFDPGSGLFNLNSIGITATFISKLDTGGNFIFAKMIGGTNATQGEYITKDNFGNIFLTGSFGGTVDFDPSSAIFNMTSGGNGFVLKLSFTGNFKWAKQFNGGGNSGISTITNTLGDVFTIGSFYGSVDFDPNVGSYTLSSSASNVENTFISKLDSLGNFIWAKSLSGGKNNAKSIALCSNNDVIICGNFQGIVDFDPSPTTYTVLSDPMFILKLTTTGNFKWVKTIGGSSTVSSSANSIALDQTNNIYVTGEFDYITDFDPSPVTYTLNGNGGDIFILKLDSSSNFKWVKQIGGLDYQVGNDIVVDIADNIFTIGSFSGVVDFNPDAGVFNLNSSGNTDIFIHKLSSTVGIEEYFEKNLFSVYPNPTTDKIHIGSDGKIRIKILNLIGQEIYSGYNKEIDLSEYNSGIYFIQIKNENGQILNTKIIKN